MKYATLDKKNLPNAFYDDSIHTKDQIPKLAVSIDEATWSLHINGVVQQYSKTEKSWSPYLQTKAEALAAAKSEKKSSMQTSYATALAKDILYQGSLFQADDKAIIALNKVATSISVGWVLPQNFSWVDSANTYHPADFAFITGLVSAIADRQALLFSNYQIAKKALASATTISAVNTVVL